MCGIAGILARRRVNSYAVKAMTDQMRHRGPDGEGIWESLDGRIILGHRRLAIIDPTPAASQPMVSHDGDYVLTFNGEIYNYLELATHLKNLGRKFRSNSDSEVLLQGYAEESESILKSLNGMFAFVIYDARRKKLFCARDRFGEKPFLYVHRSDFFAFASEYKALLCLAEVSQCLEVERLLTFLNEPRLGLEDERETIFKDIKQLLPGEYLTIDTMSFDIKVERYWSLEKNDEFQGFEIDEAAYQFKSLLSDSIKIRMRSDVPVGSCLSGGLDSASIVCLNRETLGPSENYNVFTGRFPGTKSDEWEYASEIIKATQFRSHVVTPSPRGFLSELPNFMWYNELPVGSSSQYAQWCVFRLAKEAGVTVLLDGQGADELLGGYEQYFRAYLLTRRAAGVYDANEENAIRSRYPSAHLTIKQDILSRLPEGVRYKLANLFSKGSDFRFGLTPEARDKLKKFDSRLCSETLMLNEYLREESFRAHLPTLLRYGDRNSMAHSREVRLPFCDHRIAELAFSLSPHVLMGDAQTKRLLRESMKGILPEVIRTRWNKQGFIPPQEEWFNTDLIDWVEEMVTSASFVERGFWNVAWWRAAVRRMRAGERHLAWQLWRPAICESWYRFVVDRAATMSRYSVFSASGQVI